MLAGPATPATEEGRAMRALVDLRSRAWMAGVVALLLLSASTSMRPAHAQTPDCEDPDTVACIPAAPAPGGGPSGAPGTASGGAATSAAAPAAAPVSGRTPIDCPYPPPPNGYTPPPPPYYPPVPAA